MCVCVERMDFNRHSNTCDLKVPGEVTVPFEVRFFLFLKKIFFLRCTDFHKYNSEQVCIPVGCAPPVCCPYLPASTAPRGGVSSWFLPGEGSWFLLGRGLPRFFLGRVSDPLHAGIQPLPCEQNDRCKNITFANFVCGR